VVEVEVPVFPPEQYLDPCEAEPVSSMELVLERLSGIIDCERADKDALRRWIEERRPSPEPS